MAYLCHPFGYSTSTASPPDRVPSLRSNERDYISDISLERGYNTPNHRDADLPIGILRHREPPTSRYTAYPSSGNPRQDSECHIFQLSQDLIDPQNTFKDCNNPTLLALYILEKQPASITHAFSDGDLMKDPLKVPPHPNDTLVIRVVRRFILGKFPALFTFIDQSIRI